MKKFILGGLVVVIVLSAALSYWFYFSKPEDFPKDKQLLEEINAVFPEAAPETIQAKINIDERHKLVPFITKENTYGLSYWVWDKHKWKPASIDNAGEPRIWKIKRRDVSSYHIVWNIHHDDKVSTMKLYLLKDRQYLFQDGENYYFPRIQLEQKVSLQNQSYGVMKLPSEWASVVDSLGKMEAGNQWGLGFNNEFPARSLSFGWTPYNDANEETFPKKSVNGDSFSDGDEFIDIVPFVNKADLQ
jgi:hypothetical protein